MPNMIPGSRYEGKRELLLETVPPDHFMKPDWWQDRTFRTYAEKEEDSETVRKPTSIEGAKGRGRADWDDWIDRYSKKKKQALEDLFNNVVNRWLRAKAWLPYLPMSRAQPDRYLLIEFESERKLKDCKNAMDAAADYPWPYLYLPYSSARPSFYNNPLQMDPFFGLQLPAYTPERLFVVFRFRPNPHPQSDSHVDFLFLTDLESKHLEVAQDASHYSHKSNIPGHVTSQDQGYVRYAQGLCSTCGKHTKLHVCGNCKLHGYCGVECQRKLWKSHKSLCRQVKGVSTEAKGKDKPDKQSEKTGTKTDE